MDFLSKTTSSKVAQCSVWVQSVKYITPGKIYRLGTTNPNGMLWCAPVGVPSCYGVCCNVAYYIKLAPSNFVPNNYSNPCITSLDTTYHIAQAWHCFKQHNSLIKISDLKVPFCSVSLGFPWELSTFNSQTINVLLNWTIVLVVAYKGILETALLILKLLHTEHVVPIIK